MRLYTRHVRLGKDVKVELIRRVPLFSNCSRKELAEIASIADEIDFGAGKELIREGERGREFFVLLDGSAQVTKDGTELNTLGSGDFFGEIALVSKMPRSATVTTTSDVRALVVTDRAFRALMDRLPELQLQVLEALAERLAPGTL